jgi:FMN phosphatase YigB (HAD superfamily)
VGDRYVEDIVGPKSTGMEAILKVKTGREYPESMPELDRRINAMAELVAHLAL